VIGKDDADRFNEDKKLFLERHDIDGAYNAIGIHYYSEKAKQQFHEAGYAYQEFLTISEPVDHEDLFEVLFHAHPSIHGEFSTIAITLKKHVFKKVGYFNEKLRLQQDIHLWRRLAAFCKLEAGEIEKAVAIRGVHENNRMVNNEEHAKHRHEWWSSLNKEFKKKKLEKKKTKIFEKAYYQFLIQYNTNPKAFLSFNRYILKHPSIIKESYGFFDFNFWEIFGKNWVTLHLISFKNRIFN